MQYPFLVPPAVVVMERPNIYDFSYTFINLFKIMLHICSQLDYI